MKRRLTDIDSKLLSDTNEAEQAGVSINIMLPDANSICPKLSGRDSDVSSEFELKPTYRLGYSS